MYIYLIVFAILVIFVGIPSLLVTRIIFRHEYNNNIKLDIQIEEMKEAEKRISDFLKESKLNTKASIWQIAEVLHINCGGMEILPNKQAYLSEPDGQGNMTVTFKDGLTYESRIFNFAHECAHIINKDPFPATRPDGKNKPQIEQIADYTAAALLMPIDDVYEYLEKNKYREISSKKRVTIIKALCKKYEVSEIIALRRIKEIYAIKQSET